mmetsp:Transcript_54882/g.166765  ORF Transcript_54882/g.166765 Transcript_54882/m.166765 type:complete len:231 (-) Transcript_54882:224-916(-)
MGDVLEREVELSVLEAFLEQLLVMVPHIHPPGEQREVRPRRRRRGQRPKRLRRVAAAPTEHTADHERHLCDHMLALDECHLRCILHGISGRVRCGRQMREPGVHGIEVRLKYVQVVPEAVLQFLGDLLHPRRHPVGIHLLVILVIQKPVLPAQGDILPEMLRVYEAIVILVTTRLQEFLDGLQIDRVGDDVQIIVEPKVLEVHGLEEQHDLGLPLQLAQHPRNLLLAPPM